MKRLNLLVFVLALVGCQSANLPPPSKPWTPRAGNAMIRRAIVAGWDHVNPAYYNGWKGECPGADVDAKWMAEHCDKHGLDTRLFLNEVGSREALIQAARAAWTDMRAGDLLLFFASGHGGQQPDKNGDEADRMDEYLCPDNGPLLDDVMFQILSEAPAGVRVAFIPDTCNSGTMYRGKQRKPRVVAPRGWAGQLISLGACADGKFSYGDNSGGQWTTALRKAWRDGISWRQWFDQAAALIPATQRPVWSEIGQVVDGYRNGKALQ